MDWDAAESVPMPLLPEQDLIGASDIFKWLA